MFQSLAAIQKHPNKDKHNEADKKKSAYDKIKRTKTGLPFYRGLLRSRSDLR